MRVIGTAGHVDHGKSSLIEALTGIHPDRLKEEQARAMTIDLGFGWLKLPDGREVGIVDVPGHRDFIENTVSGIAGIDAALIVVAADEGVMPQTREHLAILDLLGVHAGILVITKIDLIPDADWLSAVEADIRAAVQGTVFEGFPAVHVSARTGKGLDTLLTTLSEVLRRGNEHPDIGRPRLGIDRVFTMSGFGTVVTGTLREGHLEVGDEVQFLPSGLMGRVRGLQTHHRKLSRVPPGSRTAVNIAGIAAEQIRRGEVLTHPGQYQSTRRVDASVRLLDSGSSALHHHAEVKVFLGTGETMATLRLLGTEELIPGQEGWIQLDLREPLVCVRGDAYILRRPSPSETLGGGRIIDSHPAGRHRRFDPGVVTSLTALARGSPEDVIFEAAMALNMASIGEIITRSGLPAETAHAALRGLMKSDQLIDLEDGRAMMKSDFLIIARPHWNDLREATIQIVNGYHGKFPLRAGVPREELRSKMNLSTRLFDTAIRRLVSDQTLVEAGNWIAMPHHKILFDDKQLGRIDVLMQEFERSPFSPPSLKDCEAATGVETVAALIALGRLVPVSSEVVFLKRDYDSMVAEVRSVLEERGQITLAEARDRFRTSRKYAQALLEHLDSVGVTRRMGETRVLA